MKRNTKIPILLVGIALLLVLYLVTRKVKEGACVPPPSSPDNTAAVKLACDEQGGTVINGVCSCPT